MKYSLKFTLAMCMLFLYSTVTMAQSGKQAAQASMFHNTQTLEGAMTKNFAKIYKANIKGSPYYNEQFSPANVAPFDKVFLVRYNAALDAMEVIKGTDTLIMGKNRNYIIKQSKDNTTYRILEYDKSKKERLGYYVQLTPNGKVVLYRKDRKKFVEVKKSAYNGNLNGTSAHFKSQKSEFYIEKGNSGNVMKLPKKKKKVIALFPEKADQIKAFLKENKIKFHKEKSLIKLVNFINTL